jgi:hypothetical protein
MPGAGTPAAATRVKAILAAAIPVAATTVAATAGAIVLVAALRAVATVGLPVQTLLGPLMVRDRNARSAGQTTVFRVVFRAISHPREMGARGRHSGNRVQSVPLARRRSADSVTILTAVVRRGRRPPRGMRPAPIAVKVHPAKPKRLVLKAGHSTLIPVVPIWIWP